MASYPHLLDIGIMGNCIHGKTGLCVLAGVQCYQDGLHISNDNMKLEDFKSIIDQSKGKLFQVALGGRGDPEMHEDFEEILKYCRENDIVPNLTTSGYGIDEKKADLMKKYCGAVAVSWYRSKYTLQAIELLVSNGIKTNIHYVLGNNSIDEAYELVTENKIPKGVNRTVFLLHKPVGLGESNNVLKANDKKVQNFFALFNEEKYCDIAGFDSCGVPGIINFSPNIHLDSIDTCEGARYSAYITSDMKMTPCSFDQELKWSCDLYEMTIDEAWNSQAFDRFRNTLKTSCPTCDMKNHCLGGCPIKKEIVLCEKIQGVK
ncbi:MAG: radical SAM protein [Clostridiales bacterium]|nr:radical SAM protein [Clostridiales bacterium]